MMNEGLSASAEQKSGRPRTTMLCNTHHSSACGSWYEHCSTLSTGNTWHGLRKDETASSINQSINQSLLLRNEQFHSSLVRHIHADSRAHTSSAVQPHRKHWESPMTVNTTWQRTWGAGHIRHARGDGHTHTLGRKMHGNFLVKLVCPCNVS